MVRTRQGANFGAAVQEFNVSYHQRDTSSTMLNCLSSLAATQTSVRRIATAPKASPCPGRLKLAASQPPKPLQSKKPRHYYSPWKPLEAPVQRIVEF